MYIKKTGDFLGLFVCLCVWFDRNMYIEEVSEKGERSVEEEEVGDGDKAVLVSSGDVVVLTTKMALVGVGARALFYPTLIYNVVRNKVEAEFHWWDRVAQV